MVVYNAATRELTAKIVYYGPGLGGKTTNLHLLHDRLEPGTVGKLLNLASQSDRTIYFDLLPVELGDIKGYKIRFQLATVPGQTAFNETRRVVLKGTDGIVFVADSQWTMLPKNLESWQNLKDNLKANAVSFEGIPIVVQFNKRDLPDILSIDAMQEALGLSSYPFVEAVASAGRGVTETFKLISKLTFVDLLRRLQGRRPDEAASTPRDADDLLSWKDSLLNRTSPPGNAKSRPLTLVPTPTEEAPFETAEPEPLEVKSDTSGPFVEAAETEERIPPAVAGSDDTANIGAVAAPRELTAMEKDFEAVELEEVAESIEFAEVGLPETVETLSAPIELEEPTEPLEAEPLEAEEFLVPDPVPTHVLGSRPSPRPVAAAPQNQERVSALEERLGAIEARVASDREEGTRAAEAARALQDRLEAFERDARALGKSLQEGTERHASRLEELAAAVARVEDSEAKIRAFDEKIAAAAKRQRTSEDDVVMALKSLHERNESFEQRFGSLAGQFGSLEKALSERSEQSRKDAAGLTQRIEALTLLLEEKTSRGSREAEDIRQQLDAVSATLEQKTNLSHREAEDIRQQLAPLLEETSRRPENDQRLLAELDGLRESLAEALGELSERLRRAVRGL